eukprot:scaffold188_cov107-Isochrysis_galbana.AAC.1
MESLVHVPVAGLSATPIFHPSDATGEAETGALVFGHYRAGTFALIRAALGVDDADFAAAFRAIEVPFAPESAGGAPRVHVGGAGPGAQNGGCAAGKAVGPLCGSGGVAEVASSGASGSYFYFTPCGRFICKTISRREKERRVAVWASGNHQPRPHLRQPRSNLRHSLIPSNPGPILGTASSPATPVACKRFRDRPLYWIGAAGDGATAKNRPILAQAAGRVRRAGGRVSPPSAGYLMGHDSQPFRALNARGTA